MAFRTWLPGERAFYIGSSDACGVWGGLEAFPNIPEFPLAFFAEGKRVALLTLDGREYEEDPRPAILPYNPFALDDPANPPEFRNACLRNGRQVRIGDAFCFQGRDNEDVGIVAEIETIMTLEFSDKRRGFFPLHDLRLVPVDSFEKNVLRFWAAVAGDGLLRFTSRKTTWQGAVQELGSTNVYPVPQD